MSSESRLAVVIFAILALFIAVPWLLWRSAEANRPLLLEARVVTATDRDPVFRDGIRTLAADEAVQIAVAVRLGRPDEASRWLSPGPELELGGQRIADPAVGPWPEEDRQLRVFWFTVESSFLGGELRLADCAKQIAYRSFLAPELGQEVEAAGLPEQHNDDHLGAPEGRIPTDAGTIRLYARVELVKQSGDTRAEQAVASPGVEELGSGKLTTLLRRAELPGPIHPAAGESFRLPGYELPEAADGAAVEPACGASLDELLAGRRLITSSSFAALASWGRYQMAPEKLESQGQIVTTEGGLERRGRPLRWGAEVRSGDLLKVGGRWIVLIRDEGNGRLDEADVAMTCWKAPPLLLNLGMALGPAPGSPEHLRPIRSP